MKDHLLEHANEEGDLWCQLEECAGTYPPYCINIWELKKTVEGLEAIIENLADKEKRMAKQLWRLWYDGRHNRPFHPSHDEDEFVSIFVVCCCVLVYCSYTYSSGTELCGAFRSRLRVRRVGSRSAGV